MMTKFTDLKNNIKRFSMKNKIPLQDIKNNSSLIQQKKRESNFNLFKKYPHWKIKFKP